MNKISTAHTPAFWKRPLAGVALPFLCGAFLSACLSSLWIAFLMITGIVIFACFLFRRKRAALFLLCLFCGILHSGIYRAARPVSPQMLEGRTITAEGIVSDCNFKDNAVRCLLRDAALSTSEENVTVKLTMYGVDDLSDGDRIAVRGVCGWRKTAYSIRIAITMRMGLICFYPDAKFCIAKSQGKSLFPQNLHHFVKLARKNCPLFFLRRMHPCCAARSLAIQTRFPTAWLIY